MNRLRKNLGEVVDTLEDFLGGEVEIKKLSKRI